MKKLKINKRYSYLLLFTICIVTAFSFLKSSAVSSQINEIKTNPNTEFNITYELDGGNFTGEYPTKFKVNKETSIPNPTKEGSEFLGWTINDKTDVSPVKDYKIPPMTKSDVKLTANWKSKGNMLVDGSTFNNTIKRMSGFANVKEIRFIQVTPNVNGTDVSLSRDKSIMAHIEGSVLTVASEGEIMGNPDCYSMFESLYYIKSIELNNFNTSKVTSMNSMFESCNSLTNLDLGKFNTSNITDINQMFYSCNSLAKLNLSSWDTSKVTTMRELFCDCNSLTEIKGLENFNTNKFINTNNMFNGCTKLSGEITISNPNIKEYLSMFEDCSTNSSAKFIVKYMDNDTKILARNMVGTKSPNSNVFLYEEPSILVDGQTFNKKIKDLENINNIDRIVFHYGIPSNISDRYIMDVSQNQDKSIVVYMDGISYSTLYIASNGEIIANPNCRDMFNNITKVRNIELNNFNTSQVTNMESMFNWCSDLTEIKGIEKFSTSKVTNMSHMFFICRKITSLDLSKWDTSQVTNMESMFSSCNSLIKINGLDILNISKVSNMKNMFEYCDLLSGKITIMNPNVTYYDNIFANCSTDADSKFIVKYIDDATKEVARQMVNTKSNNSNVFLYEPPTLVDGQTFNSKIKAMSGFTNVTDIRFIQGTSNVTGTDVSEAQNRSIVAYIDGNILYVVSENEIFANSDCSYMFNGLNNITNIDFTYNFNTDNVTNMGRMFWYCKLLTSLDLSKFNTSKVTDMHMLFSNCSSLTRLNLSSFNTSNVTDMGSMFYGCKKLSSLDLSNFKTLKVTNMDTMFCYCENLTKLDLSGFNTSQVTNMSNMFNECWRLNSIKGIEIFNTSKVTNMSEMFKSCHNLNGEITIMNPNISEYKNMFFNCSQRVTGQPEYKFIVNYASGCKEVAQNMVDTKSEISNVELGTQKSLLNNDEDLDEENTIPDTLIFTIKDGREVSTKEITDRVIGSLESPVKEGKVFVGYFYDEEYTKPVSEKDVIEKDTTIYVKWEDNTNTETPQNEEIPQEENKDENLEIA